MTTPAEAPLAGVSVLDLTQGRAGAYAARLLVDAGADVVVVEPPGGAPLRSYGATDGSVGLLFDWLRAGCRSLTADLPTDADRLLALHDRAHLVLEDRGPGGLGPLGLGVELLRERRPEATIVSISPFGLTGPGASVPACEFTLQAWSGSTSTRGRPEGDYLNAQGRVGEYLTGTYAAVAALAAWRATTLGAPGGHVDLSMLEAITPTCTNVQSVWGSFTGDLTHRRLGEIPAIEATADGYVGFCIFTGQQWLDFCALVDRPDWADDPELATMGGRVVRRDDLVGHLGSWARARTTDEIVEAATALRIPVTPIGNGATLPHLDHLVARDVFVTDPHDRYLAPRSSAVVAGRVPPRRLAPAPGEHTRRLLAEVARGPAANRLDDAGTPGPGPADVPPVHRPLSGLRVVDLTQFWAGPYAGFTLAALGADVIHIESIQRPDGMRYGSARPPGDDHWWEYGPTFHAANAGKRSITLDLGRQAGRDLLGRLLEVSDALVENYSVRVIEQFGLDWPTVSARHPGLIMVRMPAFGLDGPWRDRVAFAQTIEQLTGMSWVTGETDGDPMLARGPADPLAGLHAVTALLVGLERRRRTGEGCLVESTMVETALAATAEQVIEHSATGTLLTRSGNDHPDLEVAACVATADQPEGTTGHVAIAAETPEQAAALRRIVGDDLRGWCRVRPLDQIVSTLGTAGVPAAPVVAARWGDRHEQFDHRGFYEAVEHPLAGTHRLAAMPWVIDGHTGPRFDRPAPLLGEHDHEVLGGLLGLDDAELERLTAEGVIGRRPLGS